MCYMFFAFALYVDGYHSLRAVEADPLRAHSYFTDPFHALGLHAADPAAAREIYNLTLLQAANLASQLVSILFSITSLFCFLFLANPAKARILKKPYIRGNAIEVLASRMSLSPNNLEYLDNKYSEFCPKCLVFKSAG